MKRREAKYQAKILLSNVLCDYLCEEAPWQWAGGNLAATGFEHGSCLGKYSEEDRNMIIEEVIKLTSRMFKLI